MYFVSSQISRLVAVPAVYVPKIGVKLSKAIEGIPRGISSN